MWSQIHVAEYTCSVELAIRLIDSVYIYLKANKVDKKFLNEANQVEVDFDEVDEFYDGIPDNTVTSFVDMRTDKARCFADLTTESHLARTH